MGAVFGLPVGAFVGEAVAGSSVGLEVGMFVGDPVGRELAGLLVGELDGSDEGCCVGSVGTDVGEIEGGNVTTGSGVEIVGDSVCVLHSQNPHKSGQSGAVCCDLHT